MIDRGLAVIDRFRHHAPMQETRIHPTACIDDRAEIGERSRVGAYAIVGPDVSIGDDCVIGPHAVLEGPLRLGPDNDVAAHATLGLPPQDTGYQGEPTALEIGAGNTFREFVTVHRASTKEDGVTRVGNNNLLMAYSHVGHDGQIGDGVTISNASQLAGHVHVDDQATISAVCGIHQFVHIGRLAMVGGGAVVTRDVAPYTLVAGNRARLRGLNTRGLARAGLSADQRRDVRRVYDLVFRRGHSLDTALASISADAELTRPEIEVFTAFIRASRRGLTR
ncbi:acyl-ACP--UDP-N-acetylglucosamine O-acyltransferase [Spiribacter insolitus]|uniref:Acyl-ACP--UDP-N-acetylglucosamine O-acyltransferase n=1 Tax=Spiribacter insolitus TaxID=3122417 RepID=A0ABV3T5L8_9GAMM